MPLAQYGRKSGYLEGVFREVKGASYSRAMLIPTREEIVEKVEMIEYGAYIPTLVRKLEAGEFE